MSWVQLCWTIVMEMNLFSFFSDLSLFFFFYKTDPFLQEKHHHIFLCLQGDGLRFIASCGSQSKLVRIKLIASGMLRKLRCSHPEPAEKAMLQKLWLFLPKGLPSFLSHSWHPHTTPPRRVVLHLHWHCISALNQVGSWAGWVCSSAWRPHVLVLVSSPHPLPHIAAGV